MKANLVLPQEACYYPRHIILDAANSFIKQGNKVIFDKNEFSDLKKLDAHLNQYRSNVEIEIEKLIANLAKKVKEG